MSSQLLPNVDLPRVYRGQSRDVILYACDLRYFQLGLHQHIATKPYWYPAYQPICFLLSPVVSLDEVSPLITKAEAAGILVYTFTCPELCSSFPNEDMMPLLTNYIKVARFLLAELLLSNYEHLSSVIVTDYDCVLVDRISDLVADRLSGNDMLLTWDSAKSPSIQFPHTLDFISNGRVGHPHLIMKAGFSIFKNTSIARNYLRLFRFFSMGPKQEPKLRRLFNCYYGDQLSSYYAASAVKRHNTTHYDKIAWEDYSTSSLIGHDVDNPHYLLYPKGRRSFSIIDTVLQRRSLI